MLVQQGFCRDQNRGRAVSALRRAEIGEGILERMQSSFPEAFDGQDIPGVALSAKDQAGEPMGFAVSEERRTRRLSQFTAMLRASVAEILRREERRESTCSPFSVHSNVRWFF